MILSILFLIFMIFPNWPCIRYAGFTKLQKNLPASAQGSPLGSNSDDRRQRRKQGGAVGAAASRMQATAKQTLGAATRAISPKVTERARTLPKKQKHSDNISSDKSRYYRCAVALGGRACPLRHCFAMPPLPKGEAFFIRTGGMPWSGPARGRRCRLSSRRSARCSPRCSPR